MIKLYVNHYGWVMGTIRDKDDNEVIDLRYTKHKEGAKPFKDDWNADPDLWDVLYYIENQLKCHVDKVRCQGMQDVTYMSAKDFEEIEKSAKEKMMARYRAASAIEDALARYIKTKTRAKSRKAALEKDAAINSQRFVDGVYSDLTTQCLEKARLYVLGLFDEEVADYEDIKRAWDKQLAQFEEEKRQRQEEYKKWKNGWTDASV